MRRITTCFNCTQRYRIVEEDRIDDCHDHCERFKEAYKKETELLNKAKQEMLGDREHLCYLREDKRKRQKRKGK